MPYEIKRDGPLVGISTDTALDGEPVIVQTRGFFCADDPLLLLRVLEGFWGSFLSLLPPGTVESPGDVRHALAVLRNDGTATIWLNELTMLAKGLITRSVSAGEGVVSDDLADVQRVDFGVALPEDAGFALTYQVRWERAYFFDFSALSGEKRTYDVGAALGAQFTYLMHRQRCVLTEDEWMRLMNDGWFPFILLPQGTVDLMFGLLRQNRSVDLALEGIAKTVEWRLPSLATEMTKRPELREQVPFVERAVDQYERGDYVSCISVLYPRIEGLWRTLAPPAGRVSHHRLATTVVESGKMRLSPASPLLADRFLEYLKTSFLPAFDPAQPDGLTRHTVTHGVASVGEFTKKGALLGFLILNQLRYFVPTEGPT
jgi:hypothetical protein